MRHGMEHSLLANSYSSVQQNNVDVLTTLVAFLQANGDRQAILTETGGGNTASCMTKYPILLLIHCRGFH